MKAKRGIKFGTFLLAAVLILISVTSVSGFTRTQNPLLDVNLGINNEEEFDKSSCDSGKDFLVQVNPFSCTPSIVRSDLLEEQDVNVYCQLGATQINPLVDVRGIEDVHFSGDFPKEVTRVRFYPSRAALSSVNRPVLDNIGYAVITLRRNPDESSMPDFVEGNLTATLNYDSEEVFGLGRASFNLPQFTDEEWKEKYKTYGFWAGKGYLRVEDVETDGARISVYDGNMRRISTSNLKEGETTKPVTIPGFNFCSGKMKIRLDDLEDPDTTAKLKINGESVDVTQGEKFLDNRCTADSIRKGGLSQSVRITCNEDDGRNTFELSIEPRVNLSKGDDDVYVTAERGDVIHEFEDEEIRNRKKVFLGYVGEHSDGTPFIIPVVSTAKTKTEFLNSGVVEKYVTPCIENTIFTGENSGWVGNILSRVSSNVCFASQFLSDSYPVGIYEIKSETGKNSERKKFINDGFESFFKKLIGRDTYTLISGEIRNNVSFVGFAGGNDEDLESYREKDGGNEFLRNYYDAGSGYATVIQQYGGEKYPELNELPTLDEEAAYQRIIFAEDFNQKGSMLEFCREFRNNYPDSGRDLDMCNEDFRFSSRETATEFVYLRGQTKKIEFEGVVEPDFEEYGADVLIRAKKDYSGLTKARKGQRIFLSDSEYIILEQVREDGVVFNVKNVEQEGINEGLIEGVETAGRKILGSRLVVRPDEPEFFGKNNYKISVTAIYLKKRARVSIIPDVRKSETEANFGFRIGIEKRNFPLTPEMTRKKIEGLNGTIKTIEDISDNLGKVNEGLQTACVAAGGILTAKNLLENLGGKGIARQKVMRGSGGWFERCVDLVAEGEYENQEQCLLKNAGKIDGDVDKVNQIIGRQNEDIKNVEARYAKDNGFLGDRVIDTEKFMEDYVPGVQDSLDVLGEEIENPQNNGERINVSRMKRLLNFEGWKNGNYRTDNLRDVDLHLRILESDADEGIKKSSRERLYSLFTEIRANSREFFQREGIEEQFGVPVIFGGEDEIREIIPIERDISFSEIKGRFDGQEDKINDDALVQVYVNRADGGRYLLVLDNNYVVSETYRINGRALLKRQNQPNPLSIGFEKVDSETYSNDFRSSSGDNEPVVRYFETEPYKGLPALVPFDLENGWYAATKQTIPAGGNIRTFDASGRVNSFMLCNVGKNGIEEFNSGLGDDRCTGMNLNTGQPYDQIHGLSEQKSRELVTRAVNAIEEASKKYESGVREVIINGRKIKVGSPNADIPDIQCQDFMSPSECNLLFNVCDPIICPSSRCDLGGEYPVRDVVQSGVIGSLALCLPNVKEGIVIPVCLTGVKAGLDYWNSNLKSYQECLQTSLDTKQTVGICDEIHSVYMCEMFWREGRPIMDIAVPKVIEAIAGQNVRGGGEYLSVKDALSRAEGSVNYFTQNYAEQASGAFRIRSTSEIAAPVCKNFASLVFPDSAELFGSIALTEPASPPQFTARFDEIPLTDVTVPPTSQYKVFYHIYAGENTGVYYDVYLKADSTSFYQDVASTRSVKSGFIPAGEHVTDTPDFSAPSGYRELCVNVNGQEECGFQEVSTSFAVDYVKDRYLENQASQTQISSEAECVSGTIFNVVPTENYKRNIIRICATDDPGVGSDPFAKTEKSRWRDVGHCGDEKLRCFLDSKSVEEVIKSTKVEGKVLEETAQNYLEVLAGSENYVSSNSIDDSIKKIQEQEDEKERIKEIDSISEKIFLLNVRGYLELLRANASRMIALKHYNSFEDVKTSGDGGTTTSTPEKDEEEQNPSPPQSELSEPEKIPIEKICFNLKNFNREEESEEFCNKETQITLSENMAVSGVSAEPEKNNCDEVSYDIFKEGRVILGIHLSGFWRGVFGDELIREKLSLWEVSNSINKLRPDEERNYFIRGYCSYGDREESVDSPSLSIESEIEESMAFKKICFNLEGNSEKVCDDGRHFTFSESQRVIVSAEPEKNNCDEVSYDIFMEGQEISGLIRSGFSKGIREDTIFGDTLILGHLSLREVNNNINNLIPGETRIYYVREYCSYGDREESVVSPFLSIESEPELLELGESRFFNDEENHIEKYRRLHLLFKYTAFWISVYNEGQEERTWFHNNDFKALLVAIAHRQSNLGYPDGAEPDSSSLMGWEGKYLRNFNEDFRDYKDRWLKSEKYSEELEEFLESQEFQEKGFRQIMGAAQELEYAFEKNYGKLKNRNYEKLCSDLDPTGRIDFPKCNLVVYLGGTDMNNEKIEREAYEIMSLQIGWAEHFKKYEYE